MKNMTPEEIDNAEAGPKLDLLMAKVMEYLILDITPPCDHNVVPYVTHIAQFSPTEIHYHRALGNKDKNYMWGIWQPSKDIAQAWEVIEKLYQASDYFELLRIFSSIQKKHRWQAEFALKIGQTITSFADFAPLAICRAALKAVC